MQGTIPYLGTFLTDLVMMDTAMKDYTEVRFFYVLTFSNVFFYFFLPLLMFLIFFFFFTGWSDQLWEEKKGEFNTMFDYFFFFLTIFTEENNPCCVFQEFEVIAQIKLLQLASNNYSFTQDSHFREWFACVEKLSEAERYFISLKDTCLEFLVCFKWWFCVAATICPVRSSLCPSRPATRSEPRRTEESWSAGASESLSQRFYANSAFRSVWN